MKNNSFGKLLAAWFSAFFGFAGLTMLVNLGCLAATVAVIWWVFNHVVAPSFGWPSLQVH